MSMAAKARWPLTTQNSIKLMQSWRGVVSAGGILSPPFEVPNPGCSLSQGHSGSTTVRLREEIALSCCVLWNGGCLLAPDSIISGKRDLPREHGLQAFWLLSQSAAMHIWSNGQKPLIIELSQPRNASDPGSSHVLNSRGSWERTLLLTYA